MSKTIWYISKYVTPNYAAKAGARGFFILREFSRMGHRSLLITSDSNHLANAPSFTGSRYHEIVDGVDVYWLRTVKYQSARSFRRMLSWLDFEWQLFRMPKKSLPLPDVIIVSSLSLLTVLNGLYLRKRYKCKLVFEVRDIWPMILTETGGFSHWNPFVKFLGWVERIGYKKADLTVGTMPNLKEHVHDVLGFDRPVVCIPHGLDPALLKAPQALPVAYANTYIPHDKFIVCHAGSIGADNALETLFACARKMRANSLVHFLIVGEGYLKKRFKEDNRDLPNVTFGPAVPKASVQALLSKVDVVYFAVHKAPMLKYGQSLNKVVDYMLSGKPIIASYDGYPSMINEAGCGTYVPTEDVEALEAEIDRYAKLSDEDRHNIGENGRTWLLRHRRFETLAADYLRYIDSA